MVDVPARGSPGPPNFPHAPSASSSGALVGANVHTASIAEMPSGAMLPLHVRHSIPALRLEALTNPDIVAAAAVAADAHAATAGLEVVAEQADMVSVSSSGHTVGDDVPTVAATQTPSAASSSSASEHFGFPIFSGPEVHQTQQEQPETLLVPMSDAIYAFGFYQWSPSG